LHWLAAYVEYRAMEITETIYLPTRAKWRAWLKTHHTTKSEIWFTYYKKVSASPAFRTGTRSRRRSATAGSTLR